MTIARKKRRMRAGAAAIVLAVLAVLGLLGSPHEEVFAAGDDLSAVYHDNALYLVVPYDERSSRGGSVGIEVLDPADKKVAEMAHSVSPGRKGTVKAVLSVGKTPLEDLAWYRLKVEGASGSKIVSISDILHLPVVRVFSQRAYAAGSPASMRVIAVDSKTGEPLQRSSVKIDLMDGERATPLYSGALNALGTAQAAFTLPAGGYGARALRVTATTPLGPVTFSQPVQIERRDKILLTSDKPIYQPGQTMHLRALALDGPTKVAAGNTAITLEVEDAKGNKVFKQRGRTDLFGIASADFELADEVNFGPYHIRAILGESDAATTQEKTVTVDRYTLPKFKVEVELGDDAAKRQSTYYAPGEMVEGKVTARYLFGKPLANAEVTVTLTTFDVQQAEIGRVTGKTDAEGKFAFSQRLPDFLAGRSTEQGSAPVSIGVDVKDTAQHTESKARDILVSNTPVLMMAVPESGELLPGLDNRVFILTSYPDGAPAKTTVSGNISPTRVETDASGVAVVSVRAGNSPVVLNLKATDERGRTAQASLTLAQRAQEQSLMVRTDRAVYKVGDTLRLESISTKQKGAVYVDVVKDGQTLLTQAIESDNGRGELAVDLTPAMFGTVEVRAYQITADADPISDRRLVYVDPADDLRLKVSAEREGYKPGDEARIDFEVTDPSGRPVTAALGVEIVDEAVFALSDKHPGFEKVFMYLEKELLTPRYEVHQFSFDKVLLDEQEPGQPMNVAGRERAAQVLLAAAGTVSDKDVRAEYGREAVNAKRGEYAGLYRQRVFERTQQIAVAMSAYYERHPSSAGGFGTDLAQFTKTGDDQAKMLADPWGNPFFGEGSLGSADQGYFTLISPGPDGRQKTADDIGAQVYAQRTRGTGAAHIAPFSGHSGVTPDAVAGGRVSVEGTVADRGGQPLAAVKVTVRRLANGRTVTVYSDARGRFSAPDLSPGRYDVTFEGDAYGTTIFKTFTLDAGARGTVDATLEGRGVEPIALTVYPIYGPGDDEGGAFGRVNEDMARDGGGGGFRRGGENKAAMRPAAGMPMAAPPAERQRMKDAVATKTESTLAQESASDSKLDTGEAGGEPRVRSFFPETLYTNPALITDGMGHASIRVPLADSITTWRITSLASTAHGALGSSSAPMRVFQDFFVDLDLPVSLTEGDMVSVPVAVYNYMPTPQRVTLELRQDPWFTLDADQAVKQIEVGAGEVAAATFRLKASKIGEQQMQVTARIDDGKGDAVARTVEVRPNGEEHAIVVNDRIEGSVTKEIRIPEGAIPDASKIFVKFYPGALSQVVEGLDSILQMPGGCFEQTSSSTYPNVLVMDYMKTSKKITPEIQAKAEGYISLGYQRLVTFEVPGGGFSWFGQAPANKILTAYGLMEFSDMSKVHEVDPRLIERTQAWLASQQQPDGSFKPDTYFINEGATTRYNTDVTRITAYVGWSLAATGYKGEAVDKARRYVTAHLTGKEDAYTLAVIANFAADSGLDRNWTEQAVTTLAARATEDAKTAFWRQEVETPTSAKEGSADIETTALAVQALLKSGQRSALAKKGLDYLTSNKDQFGNWSTTQATILSLKAFLLSFTKGANADTAGTIDVTIDGKVVDRLSVTKDNNDVLQMVDLKAYTHDGAHKVALSFNGKGSLQYQIVGRYYMPWDRRPDGGAKEPLSIEVGYDRTHLAQDESATAKVRVRNNTPATAKMIMVDLGIPPGFEPSGEDFAALVDASRGKVGGKLEKYTITAKQVILYFDGLNPNQQVEFSFKLKARYPVKAKTFQSRVYEYYNPTVEDKAKPVEMTVTAK